MVGCGVALGLTEPVGYTRIGLSDKLLLKSTKHCLVKCIAPNTEFDRCVIFHYNHYWMAKSVTNN